MKRGNVERRPNVVFKRKQRPSGNGKKTKPFFFRQLRTVFSPLGFSTDEDENEIDDDEDEGSSSEEFTDSIEEDVKLTAESLGSTEVKENALW